MSTNIKNAYMTMYPEHKVPPVDLFDDRLDGALYTFGILQIIMNEVPVDKRPIYILFTLDTSISMDELCKDRRSKIHHILKTFEHMVRFIAQHPDSNVTICVDIFDTSIDHIIRDTRVSNANADEIISLVKQIRPRESTDIELALLNAKDQLTKYNTSNPTHKLFHIFLTDGEANHGQTDPKRLVKLIQYDIAQNIFIGYGTTHNSAMLRKFGETPSSKYLFIDHGENSGAVYGELMQRIMFPALENAEIRMNVEQSSGEIYDWTSNQWIHTLSIGTIDSGAELTFHVRVKLQSLNIIAHIIGQGLPVVDVLNNTICEMVECIPPLVDGDGNVSEMDHSNTIVKYMFRQQTLELMFKCSHFKGSPVDNKQLKLEMSTFFKQMRGYMRTSDLILDPFMRLLCEDIVTCYKTLGTALGHMYSAARQGSQGQQTSFTPRYEDNADNNDENDVLVDNMPRLQRVNTSCSPRTLPAQPYDEAIDAGSDDDDDDVNQMPPPPPSLRRYLSIKNDDTPNDCSPVFDHIENVDTPTITTTTTTTAHDDYDEDDIDNYVMISATNYGFDQDATVYATPGRLNAIRTMSGR